MASTKIALKQTPEFKENIASLRKNQAKLREDLILRKIDRRKNYAGPFMGIDDNIENTNEETTKNVEAVKVDNFFIRRIYQ